MEREENRDCKSRPAGAFACTRKVGAERRTYIARGPRVHDLPEHLVVVTPTDPTEGSGTSSNNRIENV
jgi:hypothetical protein